MKLSLSVLGPFQASIDGAHLSHFRTKKVQALLVYLLAEAANHSGSVHRREALMELLWPGLPLKSAQVNLRQTVYQLRKSLVGAAGDTGNSILSTTRDDIGINPGFDFEIDTGQFARLVEAGQRTGKQTKTNYLEQAVALYRGDFLADFYLVDSSNFEEWASSRRSAFRQMLLEALSELTALALNRGEVPKAEAYMHRQLEMDPFNEEITRQLIQTLSLQGKRAAALSLFETYRRCLSDQLNLEPGADLLELVKSVRVETNRKLDPRLKQGPSGGLLTAAEPFFSRQAQLDQLQKHMGAALNGREQVLFITGEAGTGKTALMHEFARRSQSSLPGLLAIKGTCNAITGAGDPYLPFREILNSINSQTEAEIEEPWSSVATRDLLFEHFTGTLRRISEQHPLLILLDDLQWADAASISLLFHLVRELESSRVFIIGAYRPSELRLARHPGGELPQPHALLNVVNELTRRFGDIQVNLDNFSPQEGRSLVDTYLDQAESLQQNLLGEEFRSKLFWKTHGHPLFMVELLREMQTRSDLVRNEQGVWVEGTNLDWNILPARVEAVIQQRLSRLEPALLNLLSIASLVGEDFIVQVVGPVAGLDEQTTFRLLSQELDTRHGLVRPHGELQVEQVHLSRYQFSHALFQQFLSEQLNQGEKRLLHGRIAETLEELQDESGKFFTVQLAHHYAQAGNGRKASAYLLRAGDQARTLYAHDEAIQHYQNAIKALLEMADYDGAAHALMKLGLTHHSAFDYDQARQAYARGFKLWKQIDERPFIGQKTSAPHPFRVAWQDPSSLDPSMGGFNLTAPIVTQLFSGLVALDPDLEVVPDIAASWDMLEEGRKYIFHLREDVFWSDGRPVTAADFEFTYKRALDPAIQTPVAGLLLDGILGARDFRQGKSPDARDIGVYTLNDQTLVLELEEPVSYFLQQLTYYVLLPVPKHCVQAHGPAWAEPEHIVTNGPFVLSEWNKGKFMRLERNPRYHGRFTGNLQEVELTLDLSPGEQLERFEAGQQDTLVNWFLSSAQMGNVIQRRSELLHSFPQFATLYLIVNPGRAPFDDQRVRQAMALAINRAEIVRRFYSGQELPATGGFTPPGMPGYAGEAGLSYDPQKARQLLKAAGWKEGREFPPATLMTYPVRELLAGFLIEQWQELLQIEIGLDIRGTETFMEDFLQSRSGLGMGGWWADYADPENFLRVCVQMDLPDWHHPEYEALLERARRTTDQDLRMEIYRQADRILMEEAVIIPLVYSRELALLQPWVKNYKSVAVKHPGFWKDVVIDPH
jgi:ABC-type oligopeptide transport system substrate-binding subunit/DNA-binding SARP family transcriptional activator